MNALISRLQTPRTIRSHVVRLLVVRTLGSMALVGTAVFGQALMIQPSGAVLAAVPALTPTWSSVDQAQYPGCVAAEDWPANTWGSSVVGYSPEAGEVSRIDFDRAWELTHNADETDDVSVL